MAGAFCCLLHCPGPVPIHTEDPSGACYDCLPASRFILFLWKPQDMGQKAEENYEREYVWDIHMETGLSALKSELMLNSP